MILLPIGFTNLLLLYVQLLQVLNGLILMADFLAHFCHELFCLHFALSNLSYIEI